MTQPAVSIPLRQLEESCGLSLIKPAGRNIQLTNAGHEFLTHALAVISRLKNLEASMAEYVGMKKGRVELASGHIALVDIGGTPIMCKWYVTQLTQKKPSRAPGPSSSS